MKNILLAGATGFVGSALVQALQKYNYNIYYLTRHPDNNSNSIYWNLEQNYLDTNKLQNIQQIDTVINLTGDNISSGYWTTSKKQKIINTRVNSSQLIIQSLQQCNITVNTWLNASGIGYYGNTGDILNIEESPLGNNFLAEVCQQWEDSASQATVLNKNIRLVILRFGLVLSPTGGMLKKILPVFKLGLGSRLGLSGQQYMSWIALEDLINLIIHCIENNNTQGIYNAIAPSPVTNREFTQILCKSLNRPEFVPIPGLFLKLILGQMATELLLSSTNASAEKISKTGFEFEYNKLEEYLR